MNVLLVEDDHAVRHLWQRIISLRGHDVYAFSNAEEAWEAYQSVSFPLLFLDWMLPGMSGLDLCRRVRATPGGQYCVVLVATALDQAQHLSMVLEAGADDYLSKPVSRSLLDVRLAVAERRVEHLLGRKEAENRLRLMAAALASTDEGVLIATAGPDDAEIVFANESLTRLTGYTAQELLGASPTILQGPHTQGSIPTRLTRALSDDRPVDAEMLNYRKDGSTYVAQWNASPLREPGGEVTHWVIIHTDVTEQRRLERELVEISEREQQRIGRDLHDSLGQQLTGLGFYAAGLQRTLEPVDPGAARRAATVSELVAACKASMRQISRGLVTVDLDRLGLPLALEELAANTEHLSGLRCDVQADPSVVLPGESVAIHVYRIAQEAVNNAVQHSEAQQILITLEEEGGQVRLAVADDGVGVGENGSARPGLGMRIMAYRTRIINGTLDVRRNEQGGTTVTCLFFTPDQDPSAT